MLHILKTYFGYDTFRPLQQNIIQNILDKKDLQYAGEPGRYGDLRS